MILEEFVQHTFSMPALWESREYFRKLGNEECVRYPVLFSHLALLSAMTGRLDEARAYVDAMEMASDVLAMMLCFREKEKKPIPVATPIKEIQTNADSFATLILCDTTDYPLVECEPNAE